VKEFLALEQHGHDPCNLRFRCFYLNILSIEEAYLYASSSYLFSTILKDWFV